MWYRFELADAKNAGPPYHLAGQYNIVEKIFTPSPKLNLTVLIHDGEIAAEATKQRLAELTGIKPE